MVSICSSVRFLDGRMHAESPEWTPASSMCSITAGTNTFSPSLMASASHSSRMVQETVDQNRTVRSNADGLLHIEGQRLVVVHNLHAASA